MYICVCVRVCACVCAKSIPILMNGTIAQNKKTEESNINKIAFTFKSHIFTVDILCNTRLYFDENKLPRIIPTVRMAYVNPQRN